MALQRPQDEAISTTVKHVHSLKDLHVLCRDDVAAVIWNRDLPQSVIDYIAAIPTPDVKESRFYTAIANVADYVEQVFETSKLVKSPARDWLVNDIQRLAGQTAEILLSPKVQVRIEYIDHDACKRFHRDNVKARLICTYRGPGTDYGLSEIGGQPEASERVATGNAALLKGKLWSKDSDCVLLHRSPPIEGSGITRLVVVIDDVPIACPIN